MDAADVLLSSSRHAEWFKEWRRAINWKKLQEARSPEGLEAAFKRVRSEYLAGIYRPLFPLILRTISDPQFPRKRRAAQIRFLADSLGGEGLITPRRSRDVCTEQRKHPNPEHEIIRREFYIECTCGYNGPAFDGGCRRCGTQRTSADAHFVKGVHY